MIPMESGNAEIAMPVEFPTACAFGGENLTDLYITSAWVELGEEKKIPAHGR